MDQQLLTGLILIKAYCNEATMVKLIRGNHIRPTKGGKNVMERLFHQGYLEVSPEHKSYCRLTQKAETLLSTLVKVAQLIPEGPKIKEDKTDHTYGVQVTCIDCGHLTAKATANWGAGKRSNPEGYVCNTCWNGRASQMM